LEKNGARMTHHIIKNPELSNSELAKSLTCSMSSSNQSHLEQREELMHLMGIDEEDNERDVA